MAEEMRLESETNNIRQNAGGFSLVNVQWASFGTGASAIFVVAIIAVVVIICCWLRAKGHPRSKHRHSQLLSAVTLAIVPGPPSSQSQHSDGPKFQTFLPLKQPNGSTPPPVGPVFPEPICHPRESCLPSSHSLSSLPFSRTTGWDSKDTQDTRFPRLSLEDRRPSNIPIGRQSATALPALLSCRTRLNLLCSGSEPGAPRLPSPPQYRFLPQPPGLPHVPASPMFPRGQIQKGAQEKSSCGQSGRHQPRKE